MHRGIASEWQSGSVRTRDDSDAPDRGVPWDGATWVDVDDDGHWSPSLAERSRAFTVLGLLLGFLVLAALFAGLTWDRDGDDDTASSSDTTAPDAQDQPTTTASTTTAAPAPESVDGEAPPDGCETDDREARPLREPSEVRVNVLNGAGVNGLASSTAGQLDAAGYETLAANGPSTGPSEITYLEGFCAEAAAVAEVLDLDGASLQPASAALSDASGSARVEVLLGSDDF